MSAAGAASVSPGTRTRCTRRLSVFDRALGCIWSPGVASHDTSRPRVFPFGLAPTLKALVDARWEARQGLYVFHRDGEPLGAGAIRSAWKRATKRAGVAGRLVHDLRRTAARDFRRAGVSEGEVMQLCGWETRAMFDRYNIIDEADLAAAVAKRFNGTAAAQSGTPRASESPLTSSGAT